MRYYIIAGEASGDLHGSNLIKALAEQDSAAEFRCWGGDLMAEAGAEVVKHYRDLAFMGFAEVIMNLRTILRNISFCKEDLIAYEPDALILIDYPGFNLRIAEFAHEKGLKVFYYISPQVWAWKQSRVHKIKKVVDQMFVILPFEKDFYARFDIEVDFVGHPLLDAIENFATEKPSFQDFTAEHGLDDRPLIVLLPGSRKQEISVMLPLMLSVLPHYPDYQFVVAGAPSQDSDFYLSLMGEHSIPVLHQQTYPLLQQAEAALVTSGTATLETALFGVPEVVCYKGNAISFAIAKRLVKVDYISLVNLVMERETVKELIQSELTTENLRIELDKLIRDADHRTALLNDYQELKQKLGGSGASRITANLLLKTLR